MQQPFYRANDQYPDPDPKTKQTPPEYDFLQEKRYVDHSNTRLLNI